MFCKKNRKENENERKVEWQETKRYLELLREKMPDEDARFLDMLENRMDFAYKEKEKHKRNEFSTKNIIIRMLAELGTTVCSLAAFEWIYTFFTEKVIKPIVVVLFFVLLVIFLFALIKNQINRKKESKETWVRHTLNYNRLQNLIIRFIEMGKYSAADITEFKSEIFRQMEANLQKFEDNMKG